MSHINVQVFQAVCFLQVSPPITVRPSVRCHTSLLLCHIQFPLLNRRNNKLWRVQPYRRTAVEPYGRTDAQTYKRIGAQTYSRTAVQRHRCTDAQITQILNVQFSPVSCCFLPLMPAHIPKHPSCYCPPCQDTSHLSDVVPCQTAPHSTCNKYTCICSYGISKRHTIIIITVGLDSSVKIVTTVGHVLNRSTTCLTPVHKDCRCNTYSTVCCYVITAAGSRADRSSPPTAIVRKHWSYTSIATYIFLRQNGLQVILENHGSV